jgi:hypothetical protein
MNFQKRYDSFTFTGDFLEEILGSQLKAMGLCKLLTKIMLQSFK